MRLFRGMPLGMKTRAEDLPVRSVGVNRGGDERKAKGSGSWLTLPPRKRAGLFQALDLRLEQFIDHS